MPQTEAQGIRQAWRARVASGALRDDPAQRLAVEKLALLESRLAGYEPAQPRKVLLGLFGWGRERMENREVPGLYIYGDVGRGKSMLMDLFFQTAPVAPKRRVHFHAFMQEVHEGIHGARADGVEDPVRPVADAIADGATLLCFDELQITDITDAMIVGRLFERLFARGVVVVATSNRHPDDLYKDGLNRHLFLPFITLIKERMEVHALDSDTDHRQARMRGREVYLSPLGAGADAALDRWWQELAGSDGAPLTLRRKGRDVVLPQAANGVARGSFDDLCRQPLGPGDYLALAQAVRVLILDRIPLLSRAQNNEAKRFVTLIDALYEAKVRLICSAAAEPEALYPEGAGAFEFGRTASRLEEMRSGDWPPAEE
ncbi:cell division protein ZapE [Rhodobacteraceae bacterium 2CG4]|uniref:Cell division protein ZapE n=1 Tax=Halovulum marinum TaxID=2662447 RepID=A0A6L5YVY9_9RHOB|nr:cell division protein ZapE [Halovulum marinum]MSU88526.1 cell division protein ZapE [Halovulum marinum]